MAEINKKIISEKGYWYFIDARGNKVGPFQEKHQAEYAMDLYWKKAIGGVVKK